MAAKNGDTVRVHYTGKLENGTEFDSSIEGDPLEFKIGEGKVIPGFERGVVDMEPGDTKTITIEAENAYGDRHEEMVISVDRKDLPGELKPEVGERLEMTQGEHTFQVTVQEVTDEAITLDGNHPLAGETLIFDLELKEIS
jgi:peptidylprolyl isomerase